MVIQPDTKLVNEITREPTVSEKVAGNFTPVPASLLDALKLFMGMDPNDTTKDTQLTNALVYAIVAIETYLDRVVVQRECVEHYAHHFGVVELSQFPVNTSEDVTVTLNGVEQSDYSVFLKGAQHAVLTRQTTPVDVPINWRSFDQVVVTYTAGYDPIPADMTQAIVWTASAVYETEGSATIPGDSGNGEVKSMTIYDVGSISYNTSSSDYARSGMDYFSSRGMIPETAAQMLTAYRKMSV